MAKKKPDLRAELIAVLKRHFGKRNTEQAESDVGKAFDWAVDFLRDKYRRLPDPGKEWHNCGGTLYAALIDNHGMQVETSDLNADGIHDGIFQCEQLIEELNEANDNLNEEEQDEDEELKQEAIANCYYRDKDYCEGELWECQTCHETYCEGHWHETEKGKNVECVACERERKEPEKEDELNKETDQ